jgi:hypothetical protein
MINEKELHYTINIIQSDIQYFLRYKNGLKKYIIENRASISKISLNKILIEIETITLYIRELKHQEQEFLKLLDKMYYGKNTD